VRRALVTGCGAAREIDEERLGLAEIRDQRQHGDDRAQVQRRRT
jgi:hypothetical protein